LNEDYFRAFGTGVPEEIKRAVCMQKINVQTAREKAYMLTESSGQIARMLNEAVNLNDIDTAFQILTGLKKQYKKSYDNCKEEQAKRKEELDAIPAISVVGEILKQCRELDSEAEALDAYIGKIENILKAFETPLPKFTSIFFAEIEELIHIQKQKEDELKVLNRYLIEYTKALDILKCIKYAPFSFKELEDLITNRDKKERDLKNCTSVLERYQFAEENSIKTKQRMDELDNQFRSEFPNVCPLCGK
jgi:hypothetical protein